MPLTMETAPSIELRKAEGLKCSLVPMPLTMEMVPSTELRKAEGIHLCLECDGLVRPPGPGLLVKINPASPGFTSDWAARMRCDPYRAVRKADYEGTSPAAMGTSTETTQGCSATALSKGKGSTAAKAPTGGSTGKPPVRPSGRASREVR